MLKKIETLNKEKYTFDKYTIFLLFILIMIFSGVFGFIYETIFYKIDLGYFVKRGSTVGPWIPIYAFGGIFITLFSYKLKNKPILVFLSSIIVCGILEFATGYFLNHLYNIRLWDYNKEILNYGNIGGYICLRSVTFFGLSGLLLIYIVIPLIKLIANKLSKKTLSIISITLGLLFIIDFLFSCIIK